MSKLLLSQLRDLAELDLGIGVRFYTGSAAPHWLYDLGVPEIKLEGNTEDSYPYYPDPIYKEYYYRFEVRSSLHSLIKNSLIQFFSSFMAEAANHLAKLPEFVRSKLLYVQVCVNEIKSMIIAHCKYRPCMAALVTQNLGLAILLILR